jgi:GR25 family glycosyltransferase involved in LPS biosynthesis
MRIQDIKTVYICPNHNEKYRARKSYMDNLLTNLGFKDFEHWQSGSEQYPLCLAKATQGVLQKYIDEPVLILEDDVEFTGYDTFEWDPRADAIYFGFSLCGGHATSDKCNDDGCILEEHSSTMLRVMNMSATHAILYFSREYKQACINILNTNQGFNSDVLITRLHSKFLILAPKSPSFWQSKKFNADNDNESLTKFHFDTRVKRGPLIMESQESFAADFVKKPESKYQFIVICCSESRRKILNEQFRLLDIQETQVHFIEPATLENSKDYLPQGHDDKYLRNLCCSRSHLRSIIYAGKETSKDFSVILEDDVALHRTDFLKVIEEIIGQWNTLVFPDKLCSLGWIPCHNYKDYQGVPSNVSLKTNGYKLLKDRYTHGLQAYIVRKSDISTYIEDFSQATFTLFYQHMKAKYGNVNEVNQDYTSADSYLPRILGPTILWPMVAVEQEVDSIIGHSNKELYWDKYFKNYDYKKGLYHTFPKLPKILCVVLSIDAERTKFMKAQFRHLNFDFDYEIFRGFTKEESKDYIVDKDLQHPELDGTICCFRSYANLMNTYKDKDYDYLLTLEDDVLLHKAFNEKLYDVVRLFEETSENDYISLGYLLSLEIGELSAYKSVGGFYSNIWGFPKVWGTQALLFRKRAVNRLASICYKTTSLEARTSLQQVDKTFTKKYIRLNVDAVFPFVCRYSLLYPPLAIESQRFQSSISGWDNTQYSHLKLHPLISLDDYMPEY